MLRGCASQALMKNEMPLAFRLKGQSRNPQANLKSIFIVKSVYAS
jgi:hypothetical protein